MQISSSIFCHVCVKLFYALCFKESESCLVVYNSLRILHARILEWVAFPFSRVSSQPGIKPGLPHCRWVLYQLGHQGSPRILEWVAYPFSSRSSQLKNRTRVSCIASKFFTNWAIREVLQIFLPSEKGGWLGAVVLYCRWESSPLWQKKFWHYIQFALATPKAYLYILQLIKFCSCRKVTIESKS